MRCLILAVTSLAAGLLTACGGDTAPADTPSPVVIVITAPPIIITATPMPATAIPTATSIPAITATYAAALADILTARAQPTITRTPDLRPTRTPDLRPTYTPLPTNTPIPGPHLGSTLTLPGWTVSAAKFEKRKEIIWSDYGNGYDPSGVFWIVWLDAKNTGGTPHALDNDFRWQLTDDQGSHYPEITPANTYGMDSFAQLLNRKPLGVAVAPRTTTHVIVAFDVATDATAGTLHFLPGPYGLGSDELATIELHK